MKHVIKRIGCIRKKHIRLLFELKKKNPLQYIFRNFDKSWKNLNNVIIKLLQVKFFGLKMIQNTYFRKYINSKQSACLSLIQSGKLVIMFLISMGDSSMSLHHYVTSVHIKEESWLVGHIVCDRLFSLHLI